MSHGAVPSDKASCSYKSRKCPNPRALKRNGRVHTLCEYHRARQNEHQRKSDRKHKDTKHARQLMKQCGESNNAAHNHHHNHADVTDDIKPYPIMTTHIAASDASLPSNAPEGVLYGILHKDLSFREAMELNEALRAVTASPGLM